MENTTLCYVEKNGAYLMLHRTKKENDVNKDKYIGIGGHIEPGETSLECVIREAKEEAGLTLINPLYRGYVLFELWGVDVGADLYTCAEFTGELIECNEGELKWIKKEDINSLPLWEGDKIMFDLMESEQEPFRLVLTYNEQDELVSSKISKSVT